jgi:uncharacterized membrane protein
MNKSKWYSVIRHTLTAAGGILIAFGIVNETLVLEVSGAVIAILGVIWGIQDKA